MGGRLGPGQRRGGPSAVDFGQHGSDRHTLALPDKQLRNHAFEEDLDLDRALLRLHHRDNVARAHPIADLDMPFGERARLHVGAKRGHAKLAHVARTSWRAAAAMSCGWGRLASSRCAA